jgi:hypothetical protein
MTVISQNVTAILTRAHELTEKYGWTKGEYARDAAGNKVSSRSDEACSFCTLGFIGRAAFELGLQTENRKLTGYEEWNAAVMRVRNLIPPNVGVIDWNDKFATSLDDVRSVFQRAAAS